MRYWVGLVILLVLAAVALPFMLSSGSNNIRFRGQSDYYIGLQKPDGSCITQEVYATNLAQAEQVVRKKYCDDCTLRDLTPDYLSVVDGSTFSAIGKQCPLI